MHRELIYGIHAVKSILKKHPHSVLELHVLSGSTSGRHNEVVELALEHSIPVQYHGRKELDEMVAANHQGIIAECGAIKQEQRHMDLFSLIDEVEHAPFLLILDGVQDPHNLGACLRSANAAGVDAVIAPKDKAASLTSAARKVASGAAEVTPFFQVTNLARTIDQLKAKGIWIYGLSDQAQESIYKANLLGPIAIVMGAEGKGMRRLTQEKCDGILNIPMMGTVSSLNVSVATGVTLYEVLRQRTTSLFGLSGS